MLKEPIFITPKTYRDFERYKLEEARARGWNEAMECIFAQEIHKGIFKVKEQEHEQATKEKA